MCFQEKHLKFRTKVQQSTNILSFEGDFADIQLKTARNSYFTSHLCEKWRFSHEMAFLFSNLPPQPLSKTRVYGRLPIEQHIQQKSACSPADPRSFQHQKAAIQHLSTT